MFDAGIYLVSLVASIYAGVYIIKRDGTPIAALLLSLGVIYPLCLIFGFGLAFLLKGW